MNPIFGVRDSELQLWPCSVFYGVWKHLRDFERLSMMKLSQHNYVMHLTISMLIGAVLSWQLRLIFTCYSDANLRHANPDVRSVVSLHVRLPAVTLNQSYQNNIVPDETTPRTNEAGKIVCFWGRETSLVIQTPITKYLMAVHRPIVYVCETYEPALKYKLNIYTNIHPHFVLEDFHWRLRFFLRVSHLSSTDIRSRWNTFCTNTFNFNRLNQ